MGLKVAALHRRIWRVRNLSPATSLQVNGKALPVLGCNAKLRGNHTNVRIMLNRITTREVFEQLQERLSLRWIASPAGGERVLERNETLSRRPSLAGYLNVIQPN